MLFKPAVGGSVGFMPMLDESPIDFLNGDLHNQPPASRTAFIQFI